MAFDPPMETSKKTKISNQETMVFAGRHINIENLEKLDPVENAELYFQYICNAMPSKSSLKYIYKFVKNYHPSIFPDLNLDELKELGKKLDEMAFKENAHINILKILKELIKKIQTSPNHITCLHPIFAKHCILAKTYSYAQDIIAYNIDDFDDQVTVLDFLLYHYYGGIIAIGLKDFPKALTFFRRVITTPAKVTSSIMLESYKKYVLVSILLYGKKQPLPAYTDDVVLKKLSKSEQCAKYKDLETAFSYPSSEMKINAILKKFSKSEQSKKYKDMENGVHYLSSEMKMNVKRIRILSKFSSKTNGGLVKQCERSYTRKVIQKLTQTYVTMSFQEIAKEIGLSSENSNEIVEHHLLNMIENNEIFAHIDHSNGGMVSFYDDPERYNSNETMEKINDCINIVSQLNERVLDYHRSIKKEHILDATRKMKEFKKNIDKLVVNDESNDTSLQLIDELMQLDSMQSMENLGFGNSDDDNGMRF